MSKGAEPSPDDHDDMRPEYDFSGAVRGATARYAEGANVLVIAQISPYAASASLPSGLSTTVGSVPRTRHVRRSAL